jgi:hypothetical protein
VGAAGLEVVLRRRVSAVCAAWLCLILARLEPALAQEPIRINVNDARPVSAAVAEVEKRFGRIVTYEDASYVHPDDIVDVAEQVRRDGDVARSILVMRHGLIDVTFVPPAAPIDAQMRGLLRAILAASEKAGNAGDFRLESRPGAFHVVPTGRKGLSGAWEPYTSPLDARITLPCTSEKAAQFMERFARAVSVATGRRIWTGMFPTNLFVRTDARACGVAENARDMLWRALQSIRRDLLSWRLLCEVGEAGSCAINIHGVPAR